MENKKYTLALTLDEVNLIVAALAKLPYETVFKLMDDVRNGVSAQIVAESEPEDNVLSKVPKSKTAKEH